MISSGSAQIQITAPDTSADSDSTIWLPIGVSDLTDKNIISFQFDMVYDADVVTPLDAHLDNTIASGWNDLYYNFNTPGLMTIAAFGIQPLSGSGTLVNIQLRMSGQPEDSTAISFEFTEFSGDTSGIIKNNGMIYINSNMINVRIATTPFSNAQVMVDDTLRVSPFQIEWIKGSEHTISAPSPQIQGDIRHLFERWSDDGAQSHSVSSLVDTTFIADYKTEFNLTLDSEFGVTEGGGWYDSAAVAAFTVEPAIIDSGDSRLRFLSWEGTGENSYSGPARDTSVVMTNPITEEAMWDMQHYLEVVSDHGGPYGEGWYTEGDTATFGIDSVYVDMGDTKYIFQSWIGSGEASYNGTEAEVSLVMNSPVVETAVWDTSYLVVTRSTPENVLGLADSLWFVKGDLYSSIAAPDTVVMDTLTYFFLGWMVNGTDVPGNPVAARVDSPLVITARYGATAKVTVTTTIGAGTSVIVDSVMYSAPYTTHWLTGSEHSIDIEAFQGESDTMRYQFEGWNIGDDRYQRIRVERDSTFTALLDVQYQLSFKTEPTGLLTGFDFDWHDAGDTVSVPGVPDIVERDTNTYRFRTFTNNGEPVAGNPVDVVMSGPVSVVARYEKAFSISGTVLFDDVALADVVMSLSGAEADTVTSMENGEFEFPALFSGDYVLTALKEGYRFEPLERAYDSLSRHMTSQNFMAIDTVTTVQGNTDTDIPATYALKQNYPNPFNSNTIIAYQLPEKTTVRISIYNLVGQMVKNYLVEDQEAGHYRISWDGKDDAGNPLSSGLYIYQMRTDQILYSKKMILLE
jgi:hypothetical protein